MLKILFLCTGNSCRSQMAEGWARHLKAASIQPFSAGTEPQRLNPRAVAVMSEAGVDISHHASKHVDELAGIAWDVVITVCDHAAKTCPTLPQECLVVHAPFDDPPALARHRRNENDALEVYRRVRDEIRDYVASLPDSLPR